MRRLESAAERCAHLLAWLLVLGITALVVVSVLVPRLVGATPYTIVSGSMRPAMPPGTMVVVRPVDADQVRVGDVVTYQLRSGEPQVVTHRVVSVGIDGKGSRIFRTQGDANDVADRGWVTAAQLKGLRWYAVPHLGRVVNLLGGSQRHMVLTGLAGILLVYAAYMFASDRRRRTRQGGDGPTAIRAAEVTA
jgi:signal peptidase